MSPLTGDVVHHHCYGGVADVAGDEAAEALLPRSVPGEVGGSGWVGGGRKGMRDGVRGWNKEGACGVGIYSSGAPDAAVLGVMLPGALESPR